MTEQPSPQAWQFHLRNCDTASQTQPAHANWFGVYHSVCASVNYTPDIPKRGCCWGVYLEEPNPQGGESSVYVPGPVVLNPGLILQDLVQALTSAADMLVFIASEGDDVTAFNNSIQAALNLSASAVSQQISSAGNPNVIVPGLIAQLQKNLENAAAAVNMTPENIISYAGTLGLQPGTWGFIAGADYNTRIQNYGAGQSYDSNVGWTVVRATNSVSAKPDYIANAAFMTQGTLIYLWDRWLLPEWGNTSILWSQLPSDYWQL
jgi:hypothetical protein